MAQSQAAFRSTAKKPSHSASVIATASKVALTPALLTSTVGRPEPLGAGGDEVAHVVLARDVALDEERIGRGAELRERVSPGGLVAAAEGDARAVAQEALDRGAADPAAPSGHDRHRPRHIITVSMRVEIVTRGSDVLGECPVWLAAEQRLLRVDITAPAIVTRDVAAGTEEREAMDAHVGFALPDAAGGVIAGVGRELRLAAASRRTLAAVEPDRAGQPLQRRGVRCARAPVGGHDVDDPAPGGRGALPASRPRASSAWR